MNLLKKVVGFIIAVVLVGILGAGIYAHGSDVTVKNIEITKAFNSGFRVEAFYQSDEIVHKSNITILGKFEYNVSELFAPVVSVTSKSTDANITALDLMSLLFQLVVVRWLDVGQVIHMVSSGS